MKKRYYVAVSSGEILEDQGASSYNFEIDADEEDVFKLSELFDLTDKDSRLSLYRSHVPAMSYHEDKNNHDYDDHMKQIYQLIHDLGTKRTRDHIESMGILQ
ncbi:hypothetical protein [Pseudalkalibacillus hwajinpoensis]|uniref:Hydrolase n=1 Tax=Guptibacillus hwajinpoensis TaxID=208199 RepID=A0A4V5Q106_9BACL|nr:hypothetical protein [Pseudalkalibacillus hwajinpoensis]TKD68008.1 hypothetical protein FBF83_18345 [Pseudalkalibacillus hwajinpoensis]